MLALAVAFPLLFFGGERLLARLRGRVGRARLNGLLVCSLLLSASHPLLDWTNSYGVRPYLPWDGRWIYGDLLFIVDPWVWLMLGGACFLLTATTRPRAAAWGLLASLITVLFFRVSRQPDTSVPGAALALWAAGLVALLVLYFKGVGARFGGRVALAALALVAVYCGALAPVQARARGQAEAAARALASQAGERVLRVAATPVLANPLTWRCLSETDRSTTRFYMRLGRPSPEELREIVRYEKPTATEAELVARASSGEAAGVLLDFARFPVARLRRDEGGRWVVQFADLRYTEPGARGRVGGFALSVPLDAPPGR